MKTTPLFLSVVVVLVATALWVPPAGAFEFYSREQIVTYRAPDLPGESVGNCATCHGNFRAENEDEARAWLRDEYISPADGQPWDIVYQEVRDSAPDPEIGLHEIHRHVILDKIGGSRCSVCHDRSIGFYPVNLHVSTGSEDLEPISCVGCHGRNEDAADHGHDDHGDPNGHEDNGDHHALDQPGPGAGLRQHHTNAGINVCKTCHKDADPANYTPVGEDVPPAYYANAEGNTIFVNKPTNPCNPHGEEDYAGGRTGLDNDGDGLYDKRDPDCRPIGPGNNNGRR